MDDYYVNKSREQKEEIETIKDRAIIVKLSDNDCYRISKKAGMNGLTVGELLKNFIGDLVDGTYSNGSDERSLAEQWFDRCWFSHREEETLLRHLLEWGRDIGNFIAICDEIKDYEANPQKYVEEVESLNKNGEILWFVQNYNDYTEDFLNDNKEVDIVKEIDLCRRWYNDLQVLKGGDGFQRV